MNTIFPHTEKTKLQEAFLDRFGVTESGLWWRLLPSLQMYKETLNGREWTAQERTSIEEVCANRGFANGYIGIPKGHPFYGIHYDEIDVSIHGGLTFSEEDGDYWVIGFDTAHAGDTPYSCNEKYCLNQLMRLLQQVEDAWNPS